MDATLVKAHVRRPSTAGRGAKNPADPDADWTKTHRGRRTHFGYKVHLGVDAGTGLVRKAVLTPAKVYESEVADGLVSGDERAVYGDRAYESKRRRRWLKSQGINDRIMHRSHKHQRELPHWQKRRNELISPRRALVEKVFGTLKRSYGYSRVRYRNLGRNAVEMWFKLMAYNLRKANYPVALSGEGDPARTAPPEAGASFPRRNIPTGGYSKFLGLRGGERKGRDVRAPCMAGRQIGGELEK